MIKTLMNVVRDEEGASLVEYVLLVALIGVAAVVAMKALGVKSGAVLSDATAKMTP
jgi:pilus assembly protein Flp/PilA